ncbi:uncharacterized protein LOC119189305 [Manduca sexta]|uniref:uncharacterized protein LOC119189305 n=1 Tax=Manduca sexta TaxID=7130 RepID=UPI00188FC035|nr:uncharacterized protein LOC119189305 [Manduca sexta]
MCTPSTSTARIMSETVTKVTAKDQPRVRSPAQSVRSTASVTTRLRLAELEAAEKMAAIKRKELELEAELVKKKLALDVSAIQDDAESVQGEQPEVDVNEWLRKNPLSSRGETGESREEPRTLRFDLPRARSPTPPRAPSDMEKLAVALERMARPRVRQVDLPTFSGAVNEWLPFKAAMQDTTKLYNVSAAENIQRLRSALKGEARDVVAALLHTATDPSTIMKTLEQCFGRPEVIIDRALDELRKTSKPGSTATELNNFAIKIQNVICVLRSMDRCEYLYNPLLTREVLEKLSPHIRSRWCDYAYENEGTADPEIVVLSRFLMREADRALKYTYAPSAGTSSAAKRELRPAIAIKRKASNVYTLEQEEKQECPACSEAHVLTQCPKYKALSVEQRWNLIKEKKLCFKCANSTHRRITCKAKLCGVEQCRRPHHSSLHQAEKKPENTEVRDKEQVLSVTPKTNVGARTVLLKMCPVVVAGPRGEVRTHALLDEGATVTLMDEDLAEKIGADGPTQALHLSGVNMAQKEKASKLVTVRIRGVTEDEPHSIRARTIKHLKLHQQTIPAVLMKLKHLRDLPEELCYERARPGILLGADHWEHIVSRELRVGGRNEPAASRTLLGWVVHGTLPRSVITKKENVLHIYEREHDGLHNLVEDHFKIEALGVTPEPRVSDADRRAIATLKTSIRKIDCGYEVGLPWRQDNTAMPPSYNAALRRLRQIEHKMDASPEFAREYTAQVNNLIEKGYAVRCDGSESSSPVCWYLPHFAVQNPNKPGKQRLVFDAAATSHGVSLNDHLLEGPDMLMSLPGIMFRFRESAVAVTADIQEMFLRIKIRAEDQSAQQFLWRGNDRTNPPQRFKMTSMIFGAASSPFMAHFVRNHNANVHAQLYPRAAEAITKYHYMDDLVASYDTPGEAHEAIEEMKTVHAAAGFTLRGWNSNDESVLRDVPQSCARISPRNWGEHQHSKILGLRWDPERDELGFNTAMSRVPKEVKRKCARPPREKPSVQSCRSTIHWDFSACTPFAPRSSFRTYGA